MFLLDPNKVAGDVPGAAKQLHTLLERHKAEILASRPWDERKLQYPIKGHKKGIYYLTYFRADSKSLIELERDVALSELILRHLILYVDPKLENILLAVARDEHALALQSVTEPSDENGDGLRPSSEEGGGEDRGHRRGPPHRRGHDAAPAE
jgi:small subunit ribosomal protein S6